MHNSLPHDPTIPFSVQVVDHLTDSSGLTSLAETHDELIWSVRTGSPVALTVLDAADLPDPALLALCIAYGIYVPLAEFRRDPVGVIGELAKAIATPEIVPPRLARRRA